MGSKTGIAWTDATVNFWWGCTKVSPGCTNCYAATLSKRYGFDEWGPGKPRRQIKSVAGTVRKIVARAKSEGRRLRVFTNSMADFFAIARAVTRLSGSRACACASSRRCAMGSTPPIYDEIECFRLLKKERDLREMAVAEVRSDGARWREAALSIAAHVVERANQRLAGPVVSLDAMNHRGERATRQVRILGARFGIEPPWHPAPTLLLEVFDVDKKARRSFDLAKVHGWAEVRA